MPWTGDYVFSSGNLILDLLHNFFLGVGARTPKLRVYQMTDNPAARTMLGYLFVRGGVHAFAYAKALESLTGVKMSDMLPIPNIGTAVFPEARKFMEQGSHLKLYRFSPDDFKDTATIWNGTGPVAYTEGIGGTDRLELSMPLPLVVISGTWPESPPALRQITRRKRSWRSRPSSIKRRKTYRQKSPRTKRGGGVQAPSPFVRRS